MGLPRAALRFLLREHRRKPFVGTLVTLGRMCVYATYDELLGMCREESVEPVPAAPGTTQTSNIPAWHGTPREQNASDVAFFQMLGVNRAVAIDYSDFEAADIVANLNQPLPEDLHGRFDTVIDSGTIEHIFDTRRALINVGKMLRPGGRVIHMAPCNNFANHGFYQISPTLMIDYYQANAFCEVRAWVAALTSHDCETAAWDLYRLDLARQPVVMTSREKLLLLVVAEKRDDSTVGAVPLQAYYREQFAPADQQDQPPPEPAGWADRLKRKLPLGFRHFVRAHFLRSAHERPWGGRYLGRLG